MILRMPVFEIYPTMLAAGWIDDVCGAKLANFRGRFMRTRKWVYYKIIYNYVYGTSY